MSAAEMRDTERAAKERRRDTDKLTLRPASFRADVSAALAGLINQHRDANTLRDDDRQTALALDQILSPDAARGGGVNATISRAIKDGDVTPDGLADSLSGLPGLKPGLAEAFAAGFRLPKHRAFLISELPDNLKRRVRPGVDDDPARRGGEGDDVASRVGRIEMSTQFFEVDIRFKRPVDWLGGVLRIRTNRCHLSLLTSARAVTRYVTGAILAASRWLQRRAWVRRAAVAVLRASDTTGAAS